MLIISCGAIRTPLKSAKKKLAPKLTRKAAKSAVQPEFRRGTDAPPYRAEKEQAYNNHANKIYFSV